MTRRTLRITSVEDLAGLGRHLKFGGQVPFRLILALPGLPPDQRAGREVTLARVLTSCGCSEGAVGLLAALPAGGVGATILLPAGSGILAWVVTICLAAAIGAVAGKAAGYLRARRRLAAEVAQIMAMLSPTNDAQAGLARAA
jgi:hypothetical protein